jgi:hypothetical protein
MQPLNVKQGGVIPLVANHAPTTVRNPMFMIRADGMILAFNQDVWDVDQHTKKKLRCVQALPSSYLNRLNAMTRQRLLQEAQRSAAANQFKKQQQEEAAAKIKAAQEAQNAIHDVTDENLAAEMLMSDFVQQEEGGDTFYLSTASRDDMVAYIRDELHLNDWDWNQTDDQMRVDLAEMLGVQLPVAAAPTPTAPAPVARPRPVAAAPGGQVVQPQAKPRPAIPAME